MADRGDGGLQVANLNRSITSAPGPGHKIAMKCNLDTLPEALIFEICNHLDLVSLVTLSQVNQSLRTLSVSRSSFWIHTLSASGLVIPVSEPRPINSFTPKELAVAAHRMVYIESNLRAPIPRLRGWQKIAWPYTPGNEEIKDANDRNYETPTDALYMHLVHDDAEWAFFVSVHNVLRIVHLVGEGKISNVWDMDKCPEGEHSEARVTWAVDLRNCHEGIMVMNCRLKGENGFETPGFRLLDIVLHPETGLATIKAIGSCPTKGSATHLNISREYILVVIPSKHSHADIGEISLVRWSDMKPVKIPQLYPSIRLVAYEEYFISVGVSPNHQVWVQIVGLPPADMPLPEDSSESLEWLPVHSYLLPTVGPIWRSPERISCRVCHLYSGEPRGDIHVWLRPLHRGTRSIYTMEMDLDALRVSAKRYLSGATVQGESTKKFFVVEKESFRVLEEAGLRHLVMPAASGKRMIWWREVKGDPDAEEAKPYISNMGLLPVKPGADNECSPVETFQLYLSVIEDLAPISQIEKQRGGERLMVDPTNEYERLMIDPAKANEYSEGSAAAIQLKAAKRLEIPRGLACRAEQVYMFLIVEWSGTFLVQLRSGDMWILKYGKH
ncbi:SubName: Full=Uncharacterized protein {ECO:0000313/EMBL:CCA70098.1} [Serendipita indica DSM 11827]|uniref:F-box domain-containing protein n=1 Tax=Serendipita indica (strain DSM 11827) TaxID=1109443 RepID=G4TFK6_SERID|nr:SubName: Full=Uncharacterized protein {ECO:0000313/EMBL:CCA70098.1} [Serendipita indica DSM 11827]CCA70098.1 hypothetical protein PIIN_04038 [Serendipita indica DSM 11827]